MNRERTHLTPEEVQEFINLGVEFGETLCVWRKPLDDYGKRCWTEGWHLQLRKDAVQQQNAWDRDMIHSIMLPAPNLQEILELLPSSIKIKRTQATYALRIYNRCHENWHERYKIMYSSHSGVIVEIYSDNILDCAIQILRWVYNNHPKTLAKTE